MGKISTGGSFEFPPETQTRSYSVTPCPLIVDSCHPLLLAAALARERHTATRHVTARLRFSGTVVSQPSANHNKHACGCAASYPSTPVPPQPTSNRMQHNSLAYTRPSPAQWLIAEACALPAGALRPRRNLLQSRAPLKWDAHHERENFPTQNATSSKSRTFRSQFAGVRDKQASQPMRATWKRQARADQSDGLLKSWLEVS